MSLLTVTARAPSASIATRSLTLTFELRQKSRLRAPLDGGGEVGIRLERGTSIDSGSLLLADDGTIIEVRAADEALSIVESDNTLLLTRVAYHLGNRHVPLQIAPGSVSFLADHVLDGMVQTLGLSVTHHPRPFEPENGAYGTGHGFLSHGHSHSPGRLRLRRSHSHGADHDHDTDHDHDADHDHG